MPTPFEVIAGIIVLTFAACCAMLVSSLRVSKSRVQTTIDRLRAELAERAKWNRIIEDRICSQEEELRSTRDRLGDYINTATTDVSKAAHKRMAARLAGDIVHRDDGRHRRFVQSDEGLCELYREWVGREVDALQSGDPS